MRAARVERNKPIKRVLERGSKSVSRDERVKIVRWRPGTVQRLPSLAGRDTADCNANTQVTLSANQSAKTRYTHRRERRKPGIEPTGPPGMNPGLDRRSSRAVVWSDGPTIIVDLRTTVDYAITVVW